ncbi:MAG TPA: hypothetical protein VF545_07670, partial [Thermoleophilaceae bacterium]
APCGAGAAAAVRAGGDLPTVVADPAVPVVARRHVWRTAGDPYVEGTAIGQYLTEPGAPPSTPRVVASLQAPASGASAGTVERRLAGLRSVLSRVGLRLRPLPAATLASASELRKAIDPRRYRATVLDGDPRRLGPALGAIAGRATVATLNPVPIVAASPLLDERFQLATRVLGRTGAIATPAEVLPDSADARLYVAQARSFFRGDRPSLAGLRGYVAGLALGEGMRDGADAGVLAARLRRPRRFTDALIAPWRRDAASAGGPLFEFVVPRFLSANLLPPGAGGEPHSGTWFDGGSWVTTGARPFGLTELLK